MKVIPISLLVLWLLPLHGCLAQTRVVGGGCDGCELMYQGMPQRITAVDTSQGWPGPGQKLLVTGNVYERDGVTPAAGVIIYYWHTDATGHYTPKTTTGKAARHGDLRGWIKTDAQGRYQLYTIRPAPYPDKTMPAHIHLAVKEKRVANEYYLDELVFDDDPLLTSANRKKRENRGGSGILRPLLSGRVQVAEHNIVLGLNIPNYPVVSALRRSSGLEIGQDQPSFTPFHAYGPDSGSRACPVCKYGRYQGILYFVGNRPNWEQIKKWLVFLEKQSVARGDQLKVYFILGDQRLYDASKRRHQLETLGESLRIRRLALTYVPSFSDRPSEVYLSKIDPEAENTFIIYKNRQIVGRFIDYQPSDEHFKQLANLLTNTQGAYFHLKEPTHN